MTRNNRRTDSELEIIVGQIPKSGVGQIPKSGVGQIPKSGVGQIPNSSVGQIQLSPRYTCTYLDVREKYRIMNTYK